MNAVEIRDGFKSFSNGGSTVLKFFDMTVPQGVLYSLIGNSGCGKSSLLSCLVNLRQLDCGTIRIFGSSQISEQLYRIGYMPQDTSLYDRLSIQENLMLFGTLGSFWKPREYLEQRCQFLIDFLELAPSSRIVGSLSGGQRRRLSLAVALLNEPELLLLDEPTCGLDPLLCTKIWDHLKYLVKKQGCTVIVTTHYIEEAKHSDIIGVMRDGKLIAETRPSDLMQRLCVDSLEASYAALYKNKYFYSSSFAPYFKENEILGGEITERKVTQRKELRWQDSVKRIQQLSMKNFSILSRNRIMLAFITIVPILSLLCVCIAFAGEIQGVSVGLVNPELNDNISQCFLSSYNYSASSSAADACELNRLSCSFIREMPADVIKLKSFKSTAEAKAAVKSGELWGYVSFPKNFSASIVDLIYSTEQDLEYFMRNDELWNSTRITLSLDQSNKIIYSAVVSTLYQTFELAFKSGLKCNGFSELSGQYPLQYGPPVVGEDSLRFLHYNAPGVAVIMLFFFPATVGMRLISERRQGTLNRCLSTGIPIWEFLASYVFTEFCMLLVQSILVFLLLHYGFSLGNNLTESQIFALLTLGILQGLNGLAFGFLLGVLCREGSHAGMALISTIMPLIFLSGLFWPIQAMPALLQKLSLMLPLTVSADAYRQVINRDWGIFHPSVWTAFGVTLVYISVFSIITGMVISKSRK